jgi:hypothetical protein
LIGQPTEHRAHCDIGDHECATLQQADLNVAEPEAVLDGLDEQIEHLTIDERHCVGDAEQARHIPGIEARLRFVRGSHSQTQ